MRRKGKKFTIEVLMEGPCGDLLFQPIKVAKNDLRELVKATKNPVIKHNIEKRVKEKGVRI